MKLHLSLGLLLPLSVAVTGIPNAIPVELDANSMGAVAKAAGDAAVAPVDPSFVCNVDYTLTVDFITTLVVHNCVPAT
ncbi:hypothetical protein ZTR_01353 [Talaromyces verruculosus]|nr:hypothetical protein ZTR_01353 [Talaromyces verruculosus]